MAQDFIFGEEGPLRFSKRLTAQNIAKGPMIPKRGFGTPATLAATLLTEPILKGANWLYNRGIERAGNQFDNAKDLVSFLEAQAQMRGSVNPSVRKLGTNVLDKESINQLLTQKQPSNYANVIPADREMSLPQLPKVPMVETLGIDAIPNANISSKPADIPPVVSQNTAPDMATTGLSVEDIIDQARKIQEAKQKALAGGNEALKKLINTYPTKSGQDFYRDLGLAGLAGLTNNQAYAKMIGQHRGAEDAVKKYQMQQQLAQQEAGQIFDPMEIMANAAVMDRLGLPAIAGLSDKDTVKNYVDYLKDQSKNARELKKLAQEQEQFTKELELEREKYENPNYNITASKIQGIGSLLNAAQYNRDINAMISNPEFLNFIQQTIGFNPLAGGENTNNPTATLEALDENLKGNSPFRGR